MTYVIENSSRAYCTPSGCKPYWHSRTNRFEMTFDEFLDHIDYQLKQGAKYSNHEGEVVNRTGGWGGGGYGKGRKVNTAPMNIKQAISAANAAKANLYKFESFYNCKEKYTLIEERS